MINDIGKDKLNLVTHQISGQQFLIFFLLIF
jgi:hypothetical protein